MGRLGAGVEQVAVERVSRGPGGRGFAGHGKVSEGLGVFVVGLVVDMTRRRVAIDSARCTAE